MTPIAGKNHDVNGWVRVEPEKVLEQNRVPTILRIEDTDVHERLGDQQQQRDSKDGCRKI